ncbi:unnamed protein product [Spirodela intermedia]|uniref:Early light-induced protein n=1 Tax=Spirodela intermedia TaxID=51605 RepID=A0ABN7EAI1_SPIIN|nr:unnamed protein product [Spirodela intermedia]
MLFSLPPYRSGFPPPGVRFLPLFSGTGETAGEPVVFDFCLGCSVVAVLPPPARPKAVVSTKFSDVLAFGGPAPERINGRLAMVGFVAALGVELARGTGLAAQVAEGAGVPWFVATASVLSLASLVPLFKGVTAESRSAGLMTSDAEMWNGRFAMLGLVALAFTEFVTGGPLV